MVQLEVAQRITARPGTKDYGYFSLACQHRSNVRLGFKVSPACFVPRPKVSSAMVSFHLKPKRWDSALESDFEAWAKRHSATGARPWRIPCPDIPYSGNISSRLLDRAGIDGSRRAEALSVEEYEHLAQIYSKLRMAGDL